MRAERSGNKVITAFLGTCLAPTIHCEREEERGHAPHCALCVTVRTAYQGKAHGSLAQQGLSKLGDATQKGPKTALRAHYS